MNILLFTLEYPPWRGGVANYCGNLVKYWPESCNIFTLDNNDGWLVKKSWPVLKWLPSILALKKAIKKNRIEHVVVGHILPLGLAVLVCRLFSWADYSVILHGLDFSCAVKIKRKKILAKAILARAKKIICANSYTAELVKSFLGRRAEGKVETVNPGVENFATRGSQLAAQLKEKYNLRNKIILLSVGRLIKRKGFDKTIEAMPQILKKAPNLIYAVLGDGEEMENFKFKILNLKLEDKILMISGAADNERNSWYELCDIFIMPSRNIQGDFEGFGIVYLEAGLAGKPVIAGRSGGVGEAVKDGLTGLMVDGESVNEISQAVIKLALDPDLRDKLGEQGRIRAIKEFNWKRQAEKIYRFIM